MNCITFRKPDIAVAPVTKYINIDNISKQPVDKPKRRYKIRDILNMHASLPNKNIEDELDHKNEVCREDYFSDDSRSSDVCTDISQINFTETATQGTEFSCEINNDCKINTEMLNPFETTNRTFNLNQALLNPKTLLECYNGIGGTEVIPPPPEFADFNNLSYAYTLSSPFYDPNHYNIEDTNSGDEIKRSRSIYNDFGHVERTLTAFKELDTRTVPTEDNIQEQAKPFHDLPKINSGKANSFDIETRFSNNRKVKLGKFKYISKNILKLRK